MSYACWKYGLWIRAFGICLYVSHKSSYTALFSERQGLRKAYHFAGFVFKMIK